jgi:hypothetical protein
MSVYPRDLSAAEISPRLASLIGELAARLLDGPAAEHRALSHQLAHARIGHITLTGAGLYAYFEHPSGVRPITPPEMIGGDVAMDVQGLDAPAGSLIAVSKGRLEFVEVYTFGERGWPDEPGEISFGHSLPLPIPMQST